MATDTADTPSEPVEISELMYADDTPAADLKEAPKTEVESVTVESKADEDEETADELEESSESDETEEETPEQEGEEPADFEVPDGDKVIKVTRAELIKGYQRQADYTRKTTAIAEDRKAVQAEKARIEETAKVLTDINGELESLIMGDVQNIDWDQLRDSDVSEFLRMKEVVAAKQSRFGELVAKRDQIVKQKTDAEGVALHEALGWSDAAKRQSDIETLDGYMQANGITEQVTSHKLMKAILAAAKYEKLQAKKAATLKEVKLAPKTTKPAKIAKATAPKSAEDLMYG